ncbi:MAG: hypothetical protein PHE50_02575 [Dehalococcoidales bacterium]|nr:hypothetical protein [Dehalococcoidales bacterium]
MVDKDKTIRQYLENVRQLKRLPFITDDEMRLLFSEEIAGMMEELSHYDLETRFCGDCQKRCCLVAKCELYDTRFQMCPIYELRPVVCRMHYCHLFQAEKGAMVEEISDVFFACLMAAEAAGIPHARLFDSPPIARCAPGFIVEAEKVLQRMKNGEITTEEASGLILTQARVYRS